MNNPSLVILAAGMGSRYGSLKQIDKFGPSNETLMEYTVFDAIQSGFEKIIFVIRKSMEKEFNEIFGFLFEKADVKYVFQELEALPAGLKVPPGREKPWGTGHAVWMAEPYVNEPFAIVNADDHYGRTSLQSMFHHLSAMDATRLNACLVGYILKNTLSEHGKVSRGICEVDPRGRLQSITERTDIYKAGETGAYYKEQEKQYTLTGNETVSMNLMGFSHKVFDLILHDFPTFFERNLDNLKAEYYIPSVLENVRMMGIPIPVIPSNDTWFGVTYRQDKPIVMKRINDLIEKGIYPRKLWS